ncbi:hypothetical protein BJY16_005527 [Actinoplanes octamycinicus]|uniref:DUF2946 family protein n=1 Tax=Actinoplanes octamycinicus TaxID=135948 RepID=A0A7W7M9J0_9ACTN|nr:DUF6153 family protein [Actinoplanes octamycinicus]MBB4742068.1 hypothetical protein [Actinoplanes octamycinicus]
MISAAATIGRGARALLLLCTVFGLALMHTLGHSGVRVEHSGTAAMATMSSAAISPVAAEATGACPDDHCDGHGHVGVWSVCLAVLGGLAVVILLAMALLAVTRPGTPARGFQGSRRRTTRAPPAVRTGLTLASTAVLRI